MRIMQVFFKQKFAFCWPDVKDLCKSRLNRNPGQVEKIVRKRLKPKSKRTLINALFFFFFWASVVVLRVGLSTLATFALMLTE